MPGSSRRDQDFAVSGGPPQRRASSCRHFARGDCWRGEACGFSHEALPARSGGSQPWPAQQRASAPTLDLDTALAHLARGGTSPALDGGRGPLGFAESGGPCSRRNGVC
jgi:hypothetical protein